MGYNPLFSRMLADFLAEAAIDIGVPTANTRLLRTAVRENGLFPKPAETLTAAETCTLTVGTGGAASTLTGLSGDSNAVPVPRDSSKLTYTSGVPVLGGASYPFNRYITSRGAYYGKDTDGLTDYYNRVLHSFEFELALPACEIPTYGGGGSGVNFMVLVNGKEAATASIPNNTGAFYNVLLEFADATEKTIRIVTKGLGCNGVQVTDASKVTSTGKTYPLMTMLYDSFGDDGAADIYGHEGAIMARALGMSAGLAGVGQTGIIKGGGLNVKGQPKPNFTDATRLKDLTLAGVTSAQTGLAIRPNAGVVNGSVNDYQADYTGYANLQQAIYAQGLAIIDAWMAENDGLPLFFFGPLWPSGAPNNRAPLDMFRVRDGLLRAAYANSNNNVWFFDLLEPEVRQGVYSTATDQASLYTGGADGTDATHPTPTGHKFDGLHRANLMKPVILGQLA